MIPQYNFQFEKLCTTLKLGEILRTPEAISGGLLHRMFALETTKGKYAIKALNPQMKIPKKRIGTTIYIKGKRLNQFG